MRCKYYIICIHVHTYWMILDVSKRGVLGSADDDIAFFLHIMTVLIVHGKICLQFTCIFCIFAVHGKDGTVENVSIILEF